MKDFCQCLYQPAQLNWHTLETWNKYVGVLQRILRAYTAASPELRKRDCTRNMQVVQITRRAISILQKCQNCGIYLIAFTPLYSKAVYCHIHPFIPPPLRPNPHNTHTHFKPQTLFVCVYIYISLPRTPPNGP